jgi:hypothetical protein
MKFGIGLESLMGYDTHFDANNEPGITGVESLLEDNLFDVESGEYRASVESLSVDINVMLGQASVYGFGTEADEPKADDKKEAKTDDKKKAWYKRLWDAIVKMFKAIGGWFSSAWNWIKKKFGKGGDNDVETVSKEIAQGQINALSRIEMFIESEEYANSQNKEALKAEAKKIVEDELRKSKVLIRASGLIGKIADELAIEVANNTNNGKLDLNKVEIKVYTFSSNVLSRFKKLIALDRVTKLESAIVNFNLKEYQTDTHLFMASKRVAAAVLISGGYLFNVLFGENTIGEINSRVTDVLNSSTLENSSATSLDFSSFISEVKHYADKFAKAFSDKPNVELEEHVFKVPLNSDGSVNKNNAVDELLRKDPVFSNSRELTNFIVRISEINSKAMKNVVKGLNNFDSIKSFNPNFTNNEKLAQEFKTVLDLIKGIGANIINVIREQSMSKIVSTQTQFRKVSDSRGVNR